MAMDNPPVVAMMRALNQGAEDIWLRTHQQWPDINIDVVAHIGSTNTALMDVARAGQLTHTRVMLAAEQTQGRGRLGKPWLTRVGDALTFSIALPWPASLPLAGLSLATGVAITRALEATPHTNTDRFTPRIKWPNDIWVNDQKLAGILVEVCGQAQQRCVVIGVGVNLYPPTGVLSHSGVAPTGLANYMGDGVPPDASAVVSNCVVQLVNMLRQFKRNGFETFAAEFDALDALKGRALHLSDGSQGTALGVDAEGGLRLQGASGAVQTIISQEVSVRPCVSP